MPYTMRGKTFDDFVIDEEIFSASRTVTEADVVHFACLSGDFHPQHMNKEFARKEPAGERIAHGLLVLSMATGLLNQTGVFEGTSIAILEMASRFIKAVKFGDTIRAIQRIVTKTETRKPSRGILSTRITVLNQDDHTILEADLTILMYRRGFVRGSVRIRLQAEIFQNLEIPDRYGRQKWWELLMVLPSSNWAIGWRYPVPARCSLIGVQKSSR